MSELTANQRSVFKEARAIIQSCTDKPRRDILRDRVDECKEVFDRFAISASKDDMVELIGTWTRMLQAIDAVAPLGGDSSPAGRLSAPKQSKAA